MFFDKFCIRSFGQIEENEKLARIIILDFKLNKNRQQQQQEVRQIPGLISLKGPKMFLGK